MTTIALPTTPEAARAQAAQFERNTIDAYKTYVRARRVAQAAREQFERERDRLLTVRLTAVGSYLPQGPDHLSDEEAALMERRRWFSSTDVGRRAATEEALASVSTNGVSHDG